MKVFKDLRKDLDFSSAGNTIKTILTVLPRMLSNVAAYTSYVDDKSLSDIARITNVEPLTIISKDLINHEVLPDVNSSLLNMFAAYYLQAINIFTKIQDVEVIRILDKLNPNRGAEGFLSVESFAHVSTSLENYEYELPTSSSIALELNKEDKQQLTTNSNMSVGKLLDIKFEYNKEGTEDKREVTLPMTVRLMTNLVSNKTILHILGSKKEDRSLVERYHAWRSGRITFIKDLIFCQDLIDEHRTAVMNDDTNTIDEIIRRVTAAKTYGVITANPSLSVSSNLFVISESVAKELETVLGGKLSTPKIRNIAFENTYAMIIAVVDREWERVTFYVRNNSTSTDLSFKEIKTASKGTGPDISDILKSFQLGAGGSF